MTYSDRNWVPVERTRRRYDQWVPGVEDDNAHHHHKTIRDLDRDPRHTVDDRAWTRNHDPIWPDVPPLEPPLPRHPVEEPVPSWVARPEISPSDRIWRPSQAYSGRHQEDFPRSSNQSRSSVTENRGRDNGWTTHRADDRVEETHYA